MNDGATIPDFHAREAAETTCDRNIIVVAGAGTGKTTSLVNRLVHLLMKEPDPIPITRLVALTFTNKAATEMKVRLRERLMRLIDHSSDGATAEGGAVAASDLEGRYGLSRSEVVLRARSALQDLEKAQIGTLHSFAAHLLRLYPLQSAVDPDFREDDGLRFEEHFTEAWDVWAARELSEQGTHHELWRVLLASNAIEDIKVLTKALCSEMVDLETLQGQLRSEGENPSVRDWADRLATRAQSLLSMHDRPKRRKVEQMLAAAHSVLSALAEDGPTSLDRVAPEARACLSRDLGGLVGGWDDLDFSDARRVIGVAAQLQLVDHEFFTHLLKLLTPLVHQVRDTFSDKGWLSFDGLLARAKQLLWEQTDVRERIKHEYRAVLVDEFQDTDPIQYEIILAIAEQRGRCARTWHAMDLEPGKLFIVGDPKQSIYAFRRADIEAFDRVVEKVLDGGGQIHTLTTNFRSDEAVLGPVNDVFDRLFVRRPLVQPENVRLEARPRRRQPVLDAGVRLMLSAPTDAGETVDAAGAVRAEAEVLARWLCEEVLNRPNVRAGDVALLFSKLTQADAYLDALRRYDIPYVIEGEKHFYRRQEVIDLVNLLRVLDHPYDRIALVGLLRSALGGLSDRELYEFQEAGLLNVLLADRVEAWSHPRAAVTARLFRTLTTLHQEVSLLPLAEAIHRVFERLPVLELAAASLHGEQAVANLLKVKQTAAGLSDRPHLTLSGFIDVMIDRLEMQPEEAESPLAEDTSDAVKILTVHKAKGLEFPVVVMPGLHQGTTKERGTVPVSYDWSSALYGLSLGTKRTLGAVMGREKFAVREEAERRRVFYVGMTRAKELLVLSGVLQARASGDSVLSWLQGLLQGAFGDPAADTMSIGRSVIPQRILEAPRRKWPKRQLAVPDPTLAVDPAKIAFLWEERTARWVAARRTVRRLTPTSVAEADDRPRRGREPSSGQAEVGRLVGVLAHRVLEGWNFESPVEELSKLLDRAVQNGLEAEQEALRPEVSAALHDLFGTFTRSPLYVRLKRAEILGREVPFLMPWGESQVLEGGIDLLYRLDGRVWIADYKTDRVTADDAPQRAQVYAAQAALYKDAVKRCLHLSSASFQLLFLRPGVSVEM